MHLLLFPSSLLLPLLFHTPAPLVLKNQPPWPGPEVVSAQSLPAPLPPPLPTTAVVVHLLSCVWLFATPWTVARQASLAMGLLR